MKGMNLQRTSATIFRRFASTGGYPGQQKTAIPRRPVRKIPIGKARPPIYHQFDVAVELSDGSVIMRRSQYPKAEIRLIQDQRNNPLWNPSRSDLVVTDASAANKVNKFKQKYGAIYGGIEAEDTEKAVNTSQEKASVKVETGEVAEQKRKQENKVEDASEEDTGDLFGVDDYLSLLDDNSQQIKTGKLASKKRAKKD